MHNAQFSVPRDSRDTNSVNERFKWSIDAQLLASNASPTCLTRKLTKVKDIFDCDFKWIYKCVLLFYKKLF